MFFFSRVFMAMFVKKDEETVILICFLFTEKKCNSIFINTDKRQF